MVDAAKFCSSCGKEVTLQDDDVKLAPPDDDNHLLKLFIGGKKQHYYIRKWSKGLTSWNWAAFFFSLFWLGYRKMYKPILSILGIFIFIDLIVAILGIDNAIFNNALGLTVSCTLGICGNNLYRLHALQRIRELREKNLTKPELFLEEIQLSGGPSWRGVFASVGFFSIYILIALCIFSFVPAFNSTTKAVNEGNYGTEIEVIEVLENNMQALESEHVDDYMATVYIDEDQTIYEETKKMVKDLFASFDLAYEMNDFEFLSISEQEVKVRVTQTTTLIKGENFHNNESVLTHTLKRQKEQWKFSGSEVESVNYLGETQSIQINENLVTNEPTYITLMADSMYDFYMTEEIDVNDDGFLEIVTFRGGPEVNDNYLNDQVEILVEFETGDVISLTVVAENAPTLYLYDINLDGVMELFYETGARVTGTDIFQFTSNSLEYVETFNGAIERLDEYEVYTNKNYYTLDKNLKVTNHPENDEVTQNENAGSDETIGFNQVQQLSLGITQQDFLNNFIEFYSENLLKVDSSELIADYELTKDKEGTFTWQLEEDIYLIGSINGDNVLTRVAIYSDHSIPKETEKAAESSRIIVSAVYALIYALGDEENVDTIMQTIMDQQYKEFKDQGEYISNDIKYVDFSSDTESIFQAFHAEDILD
ncbi:Protein of unknown function [Psychrobacillus psychrotolerans]|uniref:DUF2628 domain-containing protein n=2 Tax=Psychrobacillus psychrotolerans TaxID=126156 RepID=A0A1I5Z5D4_9BACI|nr:Protein of unknown function [Psychrobacillus psychrotolerans]